jgi:hypothetical protein
LISERSAALSIRVKLRFSAQQRKTARQSCAPETNNHLTLRELIAAEIGFSRLEVEVAIYSEPREGPLHQLQGHQTTRQSSLQ